MITLDAYGKEGFSLQWPYIPDPYVRMAYLNKVKNTAGFAFNPKVKMWVCAGPEALLDLDRFEIWQHITTITPAAAERVKEFRQDVEQIIQGKYAEDDTPYGYQKAGTNALVLQRRGLLADDMGLGKSKQALDAAVKVGAQTVLVIAPKTLTYNWAAEIEKWYDWIDFGVVPDSKTERDRFWTEYFDDHHDMMVVITNYEKLRLKDWPDQQWDIVIIDEAQKVKNTQTQTHKLVKKLKSDYFWALSGTPMEIRVEELFGVMSIVRPGLLGSWTRFREQHIIVDAWGNVIGPQNLELLKDRLGPWMTRRRKQDVLKQLPPKLYNSVFIDMEPAELKEYTRIKNDFLNWLKDHDKSQHEANALTQLLRLQQFTCSPELLELTLTGSKFAMLQDVISEWEGQVMVFTRFSQMATRLLSWLGAHQQALIAGEVPSEQRVARVAQFNEGQLGKVLISTDAGAYGLNVTSADLIIHYDQLWNPGKMWQREDRLHRIGQKNTVNVVNLIVSNTVDEGMLKVLDKRRDLFHDIIDGAEDVAIAKLGASALKKIVEGKY